MALFMPYKEMWDLPLDAPAGEKRITHWFGNIIWAIVAGLCKLLFRYRVSNRQSLRGFKGESGVLVVANHTSFLDVVLMYLAGRPAQWVRFIARDTLFPRFRGLLGQIISRVGAFPITRDSADRTAVKRAARMLKNGEVVGILPEGTRRGKGTKKPTIHSGAALIAKMGHVPILPMTVRNAELVKQKGKMVRFPTISVEYGNPLLLSDFDFLPKEDRLDGCTWYAMRESFALFNRVSREEVDMKALFPDDKDFTQVFAEHPIEEHTTEQLVQMKRRSEEAKSCRVKRGEDDEGSQG